MRIKQLIQLLQKFPDESAVAFEEELIVVTDRREGYGKHLYDGDIGAIYQDGRSSKEGNWESPQRCTKPGVCTCACGEPFLEPVA